MVSWLKAPDKSSSSMKDIVTVPKQTNEQMINKQNYRVIVQLYWGLFESPSLDGILTPTPTNSGGCHTCLLSKFSRTIGISILHIWKLLSCGPLWVQMGCNIRIYSLALMSYLVKFCGSAFNDFWVRTGNMICFKRVSGALSPCVGTVSTPKIHQLVMVGHFAKFSSSI